MSTPLPSIYVHLPWCVRKCPYCDFNSYRAGGIVPEDTYVDALLRDLDVEREALGGRPVSSLFIGGGTPSLFSGTAVARLLDGIRARVDVLHGAEITLEANPGASESARFTDYRDAGVSRLSIGAQSFRGAQLAALGRAHDEHDAVSAIVAARRAGFANVNVDLMYALPDDSLAGAMADLEQALDLGPSHVSWYQLTLEPDTAFHRRPPPLPDEDLVLEIEAAGRARLAQSGFERYEVSAYARPGFRCRHNLHYWHFGDYIGIGAGAHGKVTLTSGAIERRAKTRNPRTYIDVAGTPAATRRERVDRPAQIALEFLMNALRLPEGISAKHFERCTGLPIAALRAPMTTAIERGWMHYDESTFKATPRGLAMLNEVLKLFVAADS